MEKLIINNAERVSRRKLIRAVGKAFLGFGALLLSACLPQQSETYSVKILVTQSRSHFEPSNLVISPGAKVIWQNQAIYPATVTCDPAKARPVSANGVAATSTTYVQLPKGASPWDSGPLYPGQSWEYTFRTPGEYLYFSQYSDSPYLVGTVTVKG